MPLRERHYEPETVAAGAGGGGVGGATLTAHRQAGDAAASAADAAINKALSANSQLFNEATEQEGGE